MRYYLAILVPKKQSAVLKYLCQQWNRSFDPLLHVTVLQPHPMAEGFTEEALIASLTEAGKEVPRFPINFTEFGMFKEKGIVYVGVERSDAFATCHNALYDAAIRHLEPISNHEERKYIHVPNPHVTLSKRLGAETEKAFNDLREREVCQGFTCYKVALLAERGEEVGWEEIASIDLKG